MTFQIKFHQIRAFVEVARQGSIRGASRTLDLSQPALTKSIKEREEGIAAQLFVRRSKGVALTECGEGFYQRARLILEELRAAQDDIRQRQGELAAQLLRSGAAAPFHLCIIGRERLRGGWGSQRGATGWRRWAEPWTGRTAASGWIPTWSRS